MAKTKKTKCKDTCNCCQEKRDEIDFDAFYGSVGLKTDILEACTNLINVASNAESQGKSEVVGTVLAMVKDLQALVKTL